MLQVRGKLVRLQLLTIIKMVQKTKIETGNILEELRANVEESIPKFISPNGGSLEEIQEEHLKIYQAILDLAESLDEKAFIKKEVE